LPSLAPSGVATFTVRVQPFGGPTGTLLTNVSSASSTTPDPNPANNVVTTTTTLNPGNTVPASADIAVTKTGPAGPRLVGQNVVYTVTVTNTTGGSAPAPVLSDAIPPNTTFVSAVQTSGPAFACTTPAVGAVGAVVCVFDGAFGDWPPATFTITGQVLAGSPVAGPTHGGPLARNGGDTLLRRHNATLCYLGRRASPPTPSPRDR